MTRTESGARLHADVHTVARGRRFVRAVRHWDYNWNQVRAKSEAVIARCLAGHRQNHPDVRVERHVSFHGPAQALLGSVSHAVLCHAPCPVAAVHRNS